ncbi:MAG TPA: aspartate/glutamate racemase family protein [Rhodoblastus sp.]|nr:aspartate/glutamate racemase family protein [Rhodoblastus sp.]
MITPSSNTALEPWTCRMLADMPGVTAHFTRMRVTEIALDAAALDQFDPSNMLPAANLLADAKVDAIAWNGTSASWLGVERDEAFCAAVLRMTGVKATTATLACIEAARRAQATRVGLATPYTDDVQQRIGAVWARAGVPCFAERHLALRDNFSFGEASPDSIADMCRALAAEGCDAIVLLCTNLQGAGVVAEVERETGALVIDSVAATLWRSMQLANVDVRPLAHWGRLFGDGALAKHEESRA